MTSDLRFRLTLLLLVASLGVGLAVIATAVGATTPLTASSGAAFVVSEDNVTFEHGDQQATVVNNMTRVDSVRIEQQDRGTYQVNTRADDPLTNSERSRAKQITKNNASVQQVLHGLNRYNMSVNPIRKLTVDSAQAPTIAGLNNTSVVGGTADEDETFTISVEDSDGAGTVTIDRTPEYVADEAIVKIHDPATDEMYYSVTVDLEDETVTDITEWNSN